MTPRTEAGRTPNPAATQLRQLLRREGRSIALETLEEALAVEREAAALDVAKLRYRDRLLQAKVREYAVALAIATQGDLSSALREAETWLARLAAEPSKEEGKSNA